MAATGCVAALDARRQLAARMAAPSTPAGRRRTPTEGDNPMTAILSVTDVDFAEQVLDRERPVLVDFWKPACGPCRMLAPVLEDIARTYPTLPIVKLDVEANPQVAVTYAVRSLPTIKVYSDGAVVKTIIGAKSRATLLSELAEYLGAEMSA
jgi:thioredoxin 1